MTHLARNKGDVTPPTAVTGLTGKVGQGGAVRLAWTNPPARRTTWSCAARASTCPQFPADGTRIGTRRLRQAQVDSAGPSTSTSCYGVFAFDAAGNRSLIETVPVAPAPAPPAPTTAAPAPSESGSSGSSLSDIVGIIGGGAIVLAGLAYATLRVLRREWEWHARTGYGIRDLMSVDVRDYDRTALVIPCHHWPVHRRRRRRPLPLTVTMRRVLPLVVLLLVAAGAPNALGGTPGPLSADPDPINFHRVATNDSPTKYETITNTGGCQVTISDVGVSNRRRATVRERLQRRLPDPQTPAM